MFNDPLDKQFSKDLLDAARKVNEKTKADAIEAAKQKAEEDQDMIGQFDEARSFLKGPQRKYSDPFAPGTALHKALQDVEALGTKQKAEREKQTPSTFKAKLAAAKSASSDTKNESVTLAALGTIAGSVAAGAVVGKTLDTIRKKVFKPKSVNKVKKDKPLGPEYAHEKERYYNMGAKHARNGLPARPPSTAHPELKNHYYAGHEENS